MKKIEILLVAFLAFGLSIYNSNAQSGALTITQHSNISARELIENYFLGSGVIIDTTKDVKINGSTVVNSNQIGTFINSDTSYAGRNIPITEGIVLATTGVNVLTGSSLSSSSTATNAQNNNSSLCLMFYADYLSYCAANTWISQSNMNDIICLDFWVIPSSTQMSFKYSFASKEYPNYVCSQFNDIFGLYIAGPFDENGNQYTSEGNFYNNVNIATIPGTHVEGSLPGEGDKVMINTINAGSSNSHCSAYNGNSVYFIDNQNRTCTTNGFGGYTKRLETEVVHSVPCKSYHIQIAICNIGDHAYQSAVFLEKGSFNSNMISIDHKSNEFINGDDKIYNKGCASDTMIIRANYIAGADEQPYTFSLKPSAGSSLTKGVDYDYSLVGSTTAITNQVTIPEGESEVKILLSFLHNDQKAPGTTDTLLFISEDLSMYSCLKTDTIMYILQEPVLLTGQATGGKQYCEDRLPQKDTINLHINNAVTFAHVSVYKGQNMDLHWEDTLRYPVGSTINDLDCSFTTSAMNTQDTHSYTIVVEDSCGRQWDTIITYSILGTTTKATVSDDYICEGDSVILSCPKSYTYRWSSSPVDTTLLRNGQDTTQSPVIFPYRNTSYFIEVSSDEGCKAYDTISVNVEKTVKAVLSVRPNNLTYSNPVIKYRDMSVGTHTSLWSFGDGNTSEDVEGSHTYITDETLDSNIFPVSLIVYNAANCPDTAFDTITITADFTFYVPNAFVCGDKYSNEVSVFKPLGALLEEYEIKIYNRWGTMVFEGKNQGWDGKVNGSDYAPQGIYIYDIFYKDKGHRTQRKTGTFSLLYGEN